MTLTTDAGVAHDVIDPAILYFGTPVCLLSTTNSDGSANLAPMSSVFWLGRTAVLGMGASSRTAENLRREAGCVLNLPSADLVEQVDRLALTTGATPVHPGKLAKGYRHEPDKFGVSGLTAVTARTVRAPRVRECPVTMEAQVTQVHAVGAPTAATADVLLFEARVEVVHVHPGIRLAGARSRIDPDRWRPLIMSFQHFYGLGARLHPSRLATIDEEQYR